MPSIDTIKHPVTEVAQLHTDYLDYVSAYEHIPESNRDLRQQLAANALTAFQAVHVVINREIDGANTVLNECISNTDSSENGMSPSTTLIDIALESIFRRVELLRYSCDISSVHPMLLSDELSQLEQTRVLLEERKESRNITLLSEVTSRITGILGTLDQTEQAIITALCMSADSNKPISRGQFLEKGVPEDDLQYGTKRQFIIELLRRTCSDRVSIEPHPIKSKGVLVFSNGSQKL